MIMLDFEKKFVGGICKAGDFKEEMSTLMNELEWGKRKC